MHQQVKVAAIVGSYRKGGVIDRAVDEILASAREEGGRSHEDPPDGQANRVLRQLQGVHSEGRSRAGGMSHRR